MNGDTSVPTLLHIKETARNENSSLVIAILDILLRKVSKMLKNLLRI